MNETYKTLTHSEKQHYCAVTSACRDVFGVDPILLQRKTRRARIAWPRQICMCVLMEMYDWKSKEAAGVFYGMNHATALHARTLVYDRMEVSHRDKEQVTKVMTKTVWYITKLRSSGVRLPSAVAPSS